MTLSQYLRQLAKARRRGRAAKRNRGGHIGGAAPYGYEVRGCGKRAALVPVRHERAVVKLACDMQKRGLGPGSITKRLNDLGKRTRTGRPFAIVQVIRILEKGT